MTNTAKLIAVIVVAVLLIPWWVPELQRLYWHSYNYYHGLYEQHQAKQWVEKDIEESCRNATIRQDFQSWCHDRGIPTGSPPHLVQYH
jgi:hypothetical protein